MTHLHAVQTLETMFDEDLNTITLCNIISNIRRAKYVFIYGAGSGGAYTKYLLSLININAYVFLDANAEKIQKIDGIDVCLPDSKIVSDREKNSVFIVIGVGNPRAKAEIEQKLHLYGYHQIISYIELFNEVFLMADHVPARMVKSEYFYENKQDIMKGLSLFEDQVSRDIFCGFIKGHVLKRNEYFSKPCDYPKYFPTDIKFSKSYDCFIDCGASMGETYASLEKNNISPETTVMFEADIVSFNALAKTMHGKGKTTLLYPCAVYSKTELHGFLQTATQGSSISDISNEFIQCIALDDILANINPTFIKMDIEGGEYEALIGAKSTICTNKPDLAICVYHSINHIWDIPLWLNSLNLGYKLYLRSSNIYGMNTVLYATAE